LKALDERRGDCLGAKQEACNGLGIDKRLGLRIQTSDSVFGVGDVGCSLSPEADASTPEEIGKVGPVVASLTVAPRQPEGRGWLPPSLD
jgi:hypothetical protein